VDGNERKSEIDISGQQVKDVKGAFQDRFAYAVGLGDQSKERCPVFPLCIQDLSLEPGGPNLPPRAPGKSDWTHSAA